MRRYCVAVLVLISLGMGFNAAARAQEERERVDMEMVKKIKDEGLNRSQVMDTLSYLTDVHGGRLTGSPEARRAAEWTQKRMAESKLENVHLEAWGPFGRGWTLERFSASIVAPNYSPLIAYPKAWSPSTQKVVRGKPIYLNAKTEKDLEQYRGKLHRAIVMFSPPRDVKAVFEPLAHRQSDATLLTLANRGVRAGQVGPSAPAPPAQGAPNAADQRAASLLQNSKWQMIQEEGAALVLEPGRGDGGTVFVAAANVPPRGNAARGETPREGGADAARGGEGAPAAPAGQAAQGGARRSAWSPSAPEMVPQAVMAVEQYNRIVRMLERDAPVELEFDIQSKFFNDDLMSFNIVAEIPGTDLKDEIVMLGGHFDSWHAGTGATDNAVGCGVALEALRILKAIDAKPRRTIRIALWTGEEQGLLGSKAYVSEHFGRSVSGGGGNRPANAGAAASTDTASTGDAAAQPAAAQPRGGNAQAGSKFDLKPDHAKFSAYFNLDNGSGKIRGVYLQGNEGVRPIFRSWLAPFADMGASTVTLGNTGGTDHLSFDSVGLPGFQFIQDQLEYNTRTHHSSMDVYDRLVADDIKQASVIMASFVYNAAMRDEKLPRKPLAGEVINPAAAPAAAATTTPATTAAGTN